MDPACGLSRLAGDVQLHRDVQSYSNNGNVAAKAALTVVKNVALLYVGAFCAGIGLIGKAWMYFEHKENYVWLVNKIFMYESDFDELLDG
jgi:hypothetical protein